MIRLFSHPLIPRSLWIGLFGFGLVIHMTMLVLPIYSLQIFDRVLGSGSLETLVVLTVAVVVALIGQVLLEQARARLLTGWAAGLDETYAAAIADRAIRRPPPGEIVSDGRLAGLMAFAAGKGPSALLDVVWAPAYIMVLSLLHPWLGGLAALALAALCALAWLWGRFRSDTAEFARRSLDRKGTGGRSFARVGRRGRRMVGSGNENGAPRLGRDPGRAGFVQRPASLRPRSLAGFHHGFGRLFGCRRSSDPGRDDRGIDPGSSRRWTRRGGDHGHEGVSPCATDLGLFERSSAREDRGANEAGRDGRVEGVGSDLRAGTIGRALVAWR